MASRRPGPLRRGLLPSRGGATVLKVGDKSFRERKNFSFCPLTFGILGGQTYYFSIIGIVAKPNYLCYYIVSYILIHVQCYASQ
jgi:hypothetical protein